MSVVDSELKMTARPPQTLQHDGIDWHRTKQLMLGNYLPLHWNIVKDDNEAAIDYSYVGQLGLLGITSEQDAPVPDLVLFTSRSAIPVADAVRGSFEKYGIPVPKLGVINCNEHAQTEFLNNDKKRKKEIERLKSLGIENRNIVVVEQFYNHGHGIKYASNLLLHAGVDITLLRIMKGRWYHDIGSVSFDPVTVTSGVAKGMRDIGRMSIPDLIKTYYFNY
jgi:hypothetical protein